MSDLLFNAEIQPFEQRALVRQQLEDNRRAQVIGLEAKEIQKGGNRILREGFEDIAASTREAMSDYQGSLDSVRGEVEYLEENVSASLEAATRELEDIEQGLDRGFERVDKTLTAGFIATNLALGTGFVSLYKRLGESTEEICETIKEEFDSLDETLQVGFGEVTELLEDVADELNGIRFEIADGFDKIGALFDWGFSELITQAEFQNSQLKHIIKILLKPVTVESRDLLEHAIYNYKKRFTEEALESFLYLLDEKKYRVTLGTYFPLYRFIANIYLFDKKEYDKAREYYTLAVKYAPEDATRLRSLLYLHIGLCHYYKKEFTEASDSVHKALKIHHSLEAQYQCAQYLCLQGDKKQALTYLKNVILADPKYAVRVIKDLDFISIKKSIGILLIWIQRIRILKSLQRELKESEKSIEREIHQNKKKAVESKSLEQLLVALKDCQGRIKSQFDRFQLEAFEHSQWTRYPKQCGKLIHSSRILLKASKNLLSINEKLRARILQARKERFFFERRQKAIATIQAWIRQRIQQLERIKREKHEAERKAELTQRETEKKAREIQRQEKIAQIEREQRAKEKAEHDTREAQGKKDVRRVKREIRQFEKECEKQNNRLVAQSNCFVLYISGMVLLILAFIFFAVNQVIVPVFFFSLGIVLILSAGHTGFAGSDAQEKLRILKEKEAYINQLRNWLQSQL